MLSCVQSSSTYLFCLIIPSYSAAGLSLSRLATSCGPPEYNLPAVTAGRNSDFSCQHLTGKISAMGLGCGCISERSRKSGGRRKETRNLSCKYWYDISCLLVSGNVHKIWQTTEADSVAVENLPDVRGYATSDVFVKHPTEDLWKM